MLTQRWREKRTSYRPPAEVISTREYEVATIDHGTAKNFVLTHHYSGTYPAARFRFGLHRHGQLCGVAIFSVPTNNLILTSTFHCPANDATELGRFLLLDDVPGNGESWFLARCFEHLRKLEMVGVTTFSDPIARKTADGTLIHLGHIGTIFQAFNGTYLGRGTPRTLRLFDDGKVLSDRAIQKIRSGERGWRYAAELLEHAGADQVGNDRLVWLHYWLPRVTRMLRHPGNHRYAWPLTKTARRLLPRSLPYPKWNTLFRPESFSN